MKRWHIAVGLMLIVLALAGVGLVRYLMPYKLEDEIRSAREHGVATTFSECFPPVPPDQDAWPSYVRAGKLRDGFWTADLEYPREALTSKSGPTHADLAKLRAAFNRDNGYIAATYAAVAKPGCSFGLPNRGAVVLTHPSFGGFRDAAKTLRDEAALFMWEGKPVEAAKTLRLGMNVARHASCHPTLIGALVAGAIDHMMEAGYRRLLLKYGTNAEVDRTIRDSLSTDLIAADIRPALSGEVAALCAFVEESGLTSEPKPIYRRIYYKRFFATDIHFEVKEIIASRAPLNVRRREIQAAVDGLASVRSQNRFLKDADMPPALRVMDSLDQDAARRRTIYAAACVLEYKARTGNYPIELSQAVSPVPLDPFSGAPLAYKRTANGFEVVSMEASRRWTVAHPSGHWNEMVFAYQK